MSAPEEIDGEPVEFAAVPGRAPDGETFEAIIPVEPGVYRPLSTFAAETRKKKVDAICSAMQNEMLNPESACWIVGVDPEDLTSEMVRDPSLRVRINQARARAEKALIRDVRAGGKNLDRAKAALEVLKATSWRRESGSLEVRFRHALTELQKRLKGPMTGEEAMKIVIDVFSRHV